MTTIVEANGHTRKCNARHIHALALYAAWWMRWPHACKECKGQGSISETFDPSPSGVALSPGTMTDTGPCVCVEDGRCPRCGVEALDDQGAVCYSCMWVFTDPSSWCPPTYEECGCWYELEHDAAFYTEMYKRLVFLDE